LLPAASIGVRRRQNMKKKDLDNTSYSLYTFIGNRINPDKIPLKDLEMCIKRKSVVEEHMKIEKLDL